MCYAGDGWQVFGWRCAQVLHGEVVAVCLTDVHRDSIADCASDVGRVKKLCSYEAAAN